MTNGQRESARPLLAGGMPLREGARNRGVSAPTLVPLAAGGGAGCRKPDVREHYSSDNARSQYTTPDNGLA
jgi:hypothetical protein